MQKQCGLSSSKRYIPLAPLSTGHFHSEDLMAYFEALGALQRCESLGDHMWREGIAPNNKKQRLGTWGHCCMLTICIYLYTYTYIL